MGLHGPSILIATNVPYPANSNESASHDANSQFTPALSFIPSLLLMQCPDFPEHRARYPAYVRDVYEQLTCQVSNKVEAL
jgi:hypothetical protein